MKPETFASEFTQADARNGIPAFVAGLAGTPAFARWLNSGYIRCHEFFACAAAADLHVVLTPERAAALEWYRQAERIGEHLGFCRGDYTPLVRNLRHFDGPEPDAVRLFFVSQTLVPMFSCRAEVALFLCFFCSAAAAPGLGRFREARLEECPWWFADLPALSVIAEIEGPGSIATFLNAAERSGRQRLFSFALARLTGHTLRGDPASYVSRVRSWYAATAPRLKLNDTALYSGAIGARPLFIC